MSTDFNADWAAMKGDYAQQEAAQERAAYEAKMRRDDALLTAARPVTDSWSLGVMREAAAFRAANPDPDHAAADAYLDRYLADCEAAANEVGTTPAGPDQARSEAQEAADRPTPGRGGNGASNYANARNAPTDKQVAFLASLCRELGWTLGQEVAQPRDKNHASLLIDQAKKAVDALRRSGATPAAARPTGRPATARQVEFLADLLNERVHDRPEDFDPTALTAPQASALIEELLSAPRAARAAHGIREGRYAYTPDGGATADHYRVRRDGKIVVWTAGGEWPYNGKLNEGLEWIKAHPMEAAALFGRLTETCGRCGRDLSDDDSRARGLGPVCAGKTEW